MMSLREELKTYLLERITSPFWCIGFALIVGLVVLEFAAGGGFRAVKLTALVGLALLSFLPTKGGRRPESDDKDVSKEADSSNDHDEAVRFFWATLDLWPS
jgi:hypothetical protein